MKKRRYSIGDYVIVEQESFRSKEGNIVTWVTFPCCRLAQVVGITTKYDGKIYWGYGDYSEDPNYLQITKSHQFWLVRFGLSNKAVCIAENDMRFATDEEIHPLPYSYPPPTIRERDRQNLSEDSRHWPRDSKGRWISGPCI